MADSPHSVTLYPTMTGFNGRYTYTGPYYGHYTGSAYGFGPDSAKAFGQEDTANGNAARRGASYFFGFLITFVVLLLMFVCCAIASRRRYLSRQRQRRMDSLIESSGFTGGGHRFMGFGGLLGMNSDLDVGAAEGGGEKEKPKFHEVQLLGVQATGESPVGQSKFLKGDRTPEEKWGNTVIFDAQGNGHSRKGSNWSWTSITPLSASMIRAPKDLQPYDHFETALSSTATDTGPPPSYWARYPTTGYVTSSATPTPSHEDYEDENRGWFSRFFSKRGRLGSPTAVSSESTGYPLSPISRASSEPFIRRDRSLRTGSGVDLEKGVVSPATDHVVSGEEKRMEVAVIVAMPSGVNKIKRKPPPSPEYQIGVTTAKVGEDSSHRA
ncbi:hypothetical protein CC2G_013750 [Coprinopsis cinerea AmutBmut pab1-1]|nr:hypothetical protein CC2G_013750 [Coprinopsis cinerea AmutBmut pab1-1]